MRSLRIATLIVLTGAALGLLGLLWNRQSAKTPEATNVAPDEFRRISSNVHFTVSANVVSEVLRIEQQEKEATEKYWAEEIVAQEHSSIIDTFWDTINAATNTAARWKVVSNFAVASINLPKWIVAERLPHGIELWKSAESSQLLNANEWEVLLEQAATGGWHLEYLEFRHNRFLSAKTDAHAQSTFYFTAHLRDATNRVQLEGDLKVTWGRNEHGPKINLVDATSIALKQRTGNPPFQLVIDDEIVPPGQSIIMDPLIVYDLDSDGLSEIVLAGRNVVYRNRGNFHFEREPLCRVPEEFISTALIADFDGDGSADFLCKKWEGLFLFKNSGRGTFDQKAILAWKPEKPLQKPMVMTCGDIDRDGDLDLFIGQYKEPYDGGHTPQPFYDANDGFPSYALANDGHGKFSDVTEASAVDLKRRRRTYSASFADVDRDHDLDLIVVSDFAGLDLYRNDGSGKFEPIKVESAKAFGMAHLLNDFNNDAQLDLLMVGMTAPTADRLNSRDLWRNEPLPERAFRGQMTHGNRLYMGTAAGQFEENNLSQSIARSGWSWGCTGLDFDNDGWTDIYIGNGLESNASVQDYEGEYWRHDRYFGPSTAGTASDLYFKAKFSRTRGRTHSYGGYEKNRLYMNQQGTNFFEAGYLLGVALPNDSRNVVSDDLDADGRVDLLVMTYEIWPRSKQTLKAYRNTLEQPGNWVSLRANKEYARALLGAEVKVSIGDRQTVRQIVTGDSYRSQHPPAIHLGLGNATRVDKVEVTDVKGKRTEFILPEVNRSYDFSRWTKE